LQKQLWVSSVNNNETFSFLFMKIGRFEWILRWALVGLTCLLLGASIFMGLGLVHRYDALQQRNQHLRQELEWVSVSTSSLDGYLRAFREDPAFAEHEVRSQLNYSKENEIIFRFAKE
jgi:cell division protein FtsB